jgi:hypothetical protein
MVHPYLSYWLLATACVFGVLQIAASYAGIKGLSLFNRPVFGYVIGGAVIVGVSFWFYSTAPMTVIDLWAGGKQFGLFVAGLATALVLNALLCFFVRLRTAKSQSQEVGMAESQSQEVGTAESQSQEVGTAESQSQEVGLEVLKKTTQLSLIVGAIKRRAKR